MKRLIGDLGPINTQGANRANGEGSLRECFYCGIPTEKDRNCAQVVCSCCHGSYDFVGGSSPPDRVRAHFYYHNNQIPAQQYVPAKKIAYYGTWVFMMILVNLK